jgi:hypothetical protein
LEVTFKLFTESDRTEPSISPNVVEKQKKWAHKKFEHKEKTMGDHNVRKCVKL